VLPPIHQIVSMTDTTSRRTLRGTLSGHNFVVLVTEVEAGLFDYSVTVDGEPVPLKKAGRILSKGDALQLGVAAAEIHIGALPRG
jgi:hypothetical protein